MSAHYEPFQNRTLSESEAYIVELGDRMVDRVKGFSIDIPRKRHWSEDVWMVRKVKRMRDTYYSQFPIKLNSRDIGEVIGARRPTIWKRMRSGLWRQRIVILSSLFTGILVGVGVWELMK